LIHCPFFCVRLIQILGSLIFCPLTLKFLGAFKDSVAVGIMTEIGVRVDLEHARDRLAAKEHRFVKA
jgi:hypothetical protein